MNSLAAFLSPIALLLPALAGGPQANVADREIVRATPEQEAPEAAASAEFPQALRAFEDAHRPPPSHQVTIEQRVIIRIAPSSVATRERMMATLPRRATANTFEEQRLRGCIPIDSIAGVQPAQENRLLLFMRDRRILTAALERACKAEDFYSGFYVERKDDGELCPRRDRLQSRAGASCRVDQLNRLVAVRE